MLQPFSFRRSQRWRLPFVMLGVLLLAILGGTAWTAAATPDLVVSTTDTVDTVLPGDTLTYRVAVRNNRSSGAAIDVTRIVSTLDANVLFEEASDGGVYDAGTHTVTWQPASPITLLPNRFTYRYVTVTLVTPLAVGTQILGGALAWESGDPANAAEALLDVDTVANAAPAAQDATRSTPEDVALVLDLASLVTDPNGDTLTFTITSQPASGTLSQSGSTVTYTPAPNTSGTYTFTYGVDDGQGGSDTAIVTITVTPVNDPPVTTPNSTSTLEDTAVSVAATTLLADDSDIDGGPLVVTGFPATSANGGTAIYNAGDVIYTPAPNFNGTDTVTYGVSDGVDTTPATLTITVTPVNDAPSFTSGGNVTVAEDSGAYSASWATAISAGPADEAGQSLSFAVVSNTAPALFTGQPALSPSGTLTFTPAPNASGSATIGVQLTDNGGTDNGGADTSAIQTFTITVSPANDPPTAQDQSVTVQSGQPLKIDVLLGASDPDNDPLTVSAVTQPADGGVVVDAPPTTVTFTSTPGFTGTTTFTFTLSDGNGGTATATVTVTVTRLNNKPVVIDHSYTTNEDVSLVHGGATGALSGATDADNDSLSYVRVSDPQHGTLSWYADGGFSYYPDPNYSGTDSFTFRASDGVDTSNLGTVTITIVALNDGPTLMPTGNVTVLEDSAPYSAVWFSNQSPGPADEAGQTVTRTVSSTNASLFSAQPALANDGTLTFTPVADAFGSSTVTVTLQDNGGTANGGRDTNSYIFKVTVTPVNDAPSYTKGPDITVAEDSGAYSAPWATAIAVGPANESAQSASFMVTSTNIGLFAVQPGITPGGTLLFTPAPDAYGVATVTAVLQDTGGTDNGGQDSVTRTFTITITPANDPPVANADTVTVIRDRTTPIAAATLLRNDTDPDGDTLTITGVSASSGSASYSGGTITFTPPSGFVGDLTFTYTLSDGNGGTATGTVTVTVRASYAIFLPQVIAATTPPTTPPPALAPDLVGTFSVSPSGTSFGANQPVQITATITNQGTAAADAFWVDLYINPSAAPTTTNIAWNTVCTLQPCQGLAWYVAGGLLPGQSITLTSNAGSYMSSYSIWSGHFTPGTTDLYLYVDSWNPGVATGGVAESDEANNRAELHGLTVSGSDVEGAGAVDPAALPARPAVPTR